MSTRSYRLTLLGCAIAWFMAGLHAPLLHAWTSHGHVPRSSALFGSLVVAIAAVAALVVLFRTPVAPTRH
ncbi:MAG TPA: hypothetical protein VJT85_10390 [Gemmatimonadaceae bacterium]|nr:hypothetical protein [Gemmatimonadaceae bacterium]